MPDHVARAGQRKYYDTACQRFWTDLLVLEGDSLRRERATLVTRALLLLLQTVLLLSLRNGRSSGCWLVPGDFVLQFRCIVHHPGLRSHPEDLELARLDDIQMARLLALLTNELALYELPFFQLADNLLE